MHPALAPMIERNAFIGGCDGVAVTKSAELIDADPMGTIPHALVLVIGDTVEALRAFHEVIDPKVRRVALIDTLQDEKFEAIRVAEALGRDLYAVRLDTPVLPARRLLPHPRGGPLGARLPRLRARARSSPRAGSTSTRSAAQSRWWTPTGWGRRSPTRPVLNFALDIMEIDGRPMAKRGKHSGSKRVLRCRGTAGRPSSCPPTSRSARCPCGGAYEDLLKPLIRGGRIVRDLPPPRTLREHVLEQLRRVPLELPGAGGLRGDF